MRHTETEWMLADRSCGASFEPLTTLNQWWDSLTPALPFQARTTDEFSTWQQRIRAAVQEKLGTMPEPLSPEPHILMEGALEAGVRFRYGEVETARGMRVPFMLLIPEHLASPAPGVLCLHGHGDGMNPLFGFNAAGQPLSGEYQHAFALEACRRGFVALAYDQLGFGRRRDFAYIERFKVPACDLPTKLAMQLGSSMVGLRVFDARQLLTLLGTQPEVAGERLGITGISGGGTIAFFTTLLDDRVRAAMISGYFNRFSTFMQLHHCIDNFVPGLATVAEMADMGCAIAPRPLLISHGQRDPIFPIASTQHSVDCLRKAYRLFDATDRIATEFFDDEHIYSHARVWDFFSTWL